MGFRKEIGDAVVSALGKLLVSNGGFVATLETFSGTPSGLMALMKEKVSVGPLMLVVVGRREWSQGGRGDYYGDALVNVRVVYFGRFERGEKQALETAWAGADKSVDDANDEVVAALQRGQMRLYGGLLPPVEMVGDEPVEDEEFGLYGLVEFRVKVPEMLVASGSGLKRKLGMVGS